MISVIPNLHFNSFAIILASRKAINIYAIYAFYDFLAFAIDKDII
jgi:hypothetical protein